MLQRISSVSQKIQHWLSPLGIELPRRLKGDGEQEKLTLNKVYQPPNRASDATNCIHRTACRTSYCINCASSGALNPRQAFGCLGLDLARRFFGLGCGLGCSGLTAEGGAPRQQLLLSDDGSREVERHWVSLDGVERGGKANWGLDVAEIGWLRWR